MATSTLHSSVPLDIGPARFGLTVAVMDGEGTLHPLAHDDTGTTFSGDGIQLTLQVAETDNVAAIRVEAAIETESLFQTVRTFAAAGAIRLALTPVAGAMGSRYTPLTCWAAPFFGAEVGEVPREVASLVWQSDDSCCP